ncbi:oxygenase MpaB family protein [Nocardia carnea]|uniref:oxygenase MpaB family protein n=2 Tax=Nocardia carnea TaxID=37328 RepID=UPI0002EC5813|nr:oxygenase MpaB family protein [Nocardia carnea]
MAMGDGQRLADPPLLKQFPFTVALRRFGGDVRASAGQRSAFLDAATRTGDPEADALVSMFRRLPAGEGRRLFDAAVDHGITAVEDPSPELVAFFASVDAEPYWLDRGQLDLAARAVGRSGVVGDIALSMGALLGGYLAHRVAKTLVGTHDLERMAPRRIAETMHWYVEATAVGGLYRFAPGFRSTLRVRLMHAMVRAGMSRRPDWDWDGWEHPVNRSQLAGTITFFAVAQISGAQALGLHYSAEEKAAICAFFRYLAYLLGIGPDLLAATERDYWRLFWLQIDHEFSAPDQDSVRLAQALVRAIGPAVAGDGADVAHRVARWAATGFLCGYARLIVGKPNADFLGLPDSTAFQALVAATAATLSTVEAVRRVTPGATRLCEHYGRRSRVRSVEKMMARHYGDHRFSRSDRHLHEHDRPVHSPPNLRPIAESLEIS